MRLFFSDHKIATILTWRLYLCALCTLNWTNFWSGCRFNNLIENRRNRAKFLRRFKEKKKKKNYIEKTFYAKEDRRIPSSQLRGGRGGFEYAWTTVHCLIIFDGYKIRVNRESADYPAESSMLLKPHCVSSIPIRFHGDRRELAPQIRSSRMVLPRLYWKNDVRNSRSYPEYSWRSRD